LVDTVNEPPPDAMSAPATTRRPFPSAPRSGLRHSLEETNGRSMLKRRAIALGVPSMPGPLSLIT